MVRLSFRTLAVVALAVAPALVAPSSASAEVLRHVATGFTATAPADFKVSFRQRSGSYVLVSRRRSATLHYRRLRTNRSPRAVVRLLTRVAAARVAGHRAGWRAGRILLADGTIIRVRRSGRRAIALVRFEPSASAGGRRRLLARIGRSIAGGRASRLRLLAQRAPRGRAAKPDSGRGNEPTGEKRRGRGRPHESPTEDPGASEPEADDGTDAGGGNVLFAGDFEDGGFDDWYVQSLDERATIVSPGAFGSDHAARFEVRDGDIEPDTGSERSEVSGPTIHEGQDLYIRDSLRIPSGSSIGTSWLIVSQLHEHDWGGSPGIAVFVDRGNELRSGAGDGSPTFVEDIELEFDRWHDLVYRVNLSQDPDEGFLEAWLDGQQLELANGETRMYGQTVQAESTYLKAGIYRGRSSTGTTVVQHDNLTIATTLEAAMAGR